MDQIDQLITPLKGTLQTVTHNLPPQLRDAAISLLGTTCYNSLIRDLDVSSSNTECITLGISKALGIAIVSASAIVKLPQLIKLIQSQSAAGLSFLSYLLETSALTITLAYNVRRGFPFSTFGETAFITTQNVVIAALILVYSGRGPMAAAFVAAFGAALYALFAPSNIVDMQTLSYLQAGAGLLAVASKVPQIVTIWSQGGTGQLSAFAVFNYVFGSLTRIFTTLKEVDDKLILYGFVAGFVFNLIISLQMVYYWNAPTTNKSKGKVPVRIQEKEEPIASTTATSSPAFSRKAPSTRRRG